MLATLSLVAAGLGVTLVPQSMRRLRVHGVAYRPLDEPPGLVAPLNLAYRRGRELGRGAALYRAGPPRGALTRAAAAYALARSCGTSRAG